MPRRVPRRVLAAVVSVLTCGAALPGWLHAASVGIPGLKLIVVDKLATTDRAKLVFVAKNAAGIGKGAAGDPTLLDGTLDVFYSDASSTIGSFTIPSPWLVDKDTVAKYVNKSAPGGAGDVKVAVVKPGKVAKVVAKGIGDATMLDLLAAGAPGAGGVTAQLTVHNQNNAGGLTTRMCTRFSAGEGSTVVFKEIAGGMGRKLVAKNGVAASCTGVGFETVSISSTAEPAETPGSGATDASGYPTVATEFGTTAVDLNQATYTRFYREPDDGTAPDAILVLVPGFEGGATSFKPLAENTILRAWNEQGLRVEVWAYDRRTHLLEDRAGIAIAAALGDPVVALDWLYGGDLGMTLSPALAAGPNRRAVFHNTSTDVPFMANWTNFVFSRDIDAVVETARAAAQNQNVFLGGHSAGTGFAARYAATDFDTSGLGPAQPGYAKVRGLVLLEGGGGSAGTPLTSDSLDRIEDRADGGLFSAVRDAAPRCVDGTPCTVATEGVDCAGKGHGTCTPDTFAYAIVPGLLNPQILASIEPVAIQAIGDPDGGLGILQTPQPPLGKKATADVPSLTVLGALPQSTAYGGLGSFMDDDGFISSIATFVRTSLGAPGPTIDGVLTWLGIHEAAMPASVLPNNGPAPTSLPAGVWGQEKEVTDIDRMFELFVLPDTNFTDWYYPSAGVGTTSVPGTCDTGTSLCTRGAVGAACAQDGDCNQAVNLDSAQLSVGRGRPDIENLTQSGAIDVPVIAFGGSNGLTPVPASYLGFAQTIGTCTAPSCDGTPRVIDPSLPNPAFPTFGGVAGGYEVHVNEGFAHVDVVTADDGPDNQVIGPLVDFLARNVQ